MYRKTPIASSADLDGTMAYKAAAATLNLHSGCCTDAAHLMLMLRNMLLPELLGFTCNVNSNVLFIMHHVRQKQQPGCCQSIYNLDWLRTGLKHHLLSHAALSKDAPKSEGFVSSSRYNTGPIRALRQVQHS